MKRILIICAAMLFFLCACQAANPTPPPAPETVKEATPSLSQEIAVQSGTQPNASSKNPIVTIEMEDGAKILVELFPDKAPNTVNNFISLVSSGFYDGTGFHRIMSDFMIQGGDPQGTGTGGPGYRIKGEMPNNGFTQNDISHVIGVISMARTPDSFDSAGCQFFIVVADSTFLDGDYAPFGKVIDGMDTVNKIKDVPVNSSAKPKTAQTMKKVTVDTFGASYPAPEKMS